MSKSKPGMTIADVRHEVAGDWGRHDNIKRANEMRERFDKHIARVLPEYAKAFNMTEEQVWRALEDRRSYWSANYYQEANQPRLDGVLVFKTTEEMMAAIEPQKGFRCPMCNGVSKNHETCDSGEEMAPGQPCDWKAGGLLRTLGKGLRVVVVEQFLNNGVIHEIFMPIALEASDSVVERAQPTP